MPADILERLSRLFTFRFYICQKWPCLGPLTWSRGGQPRSPRASLRHLSLPTGRGFQQVSAVTGAISSSRPFYPGCQRYLFLMPLIHFPVVLTRQPAHICCHQEVSIVHTAQFVGPKPTVGLILQCLPLKFQFQSITLRSWH